MLRLARVHNGLVVAGLALAAAVLLLTPTRAEAPKGKKYALLVGVRAYDHSSLADLKHTENDVEKLAGLLGKAGFDIVVLTTTRGEKRAADRPTAANIRAALTKLLEKVTKHDTMLVALSGHGLHFELEEGGKKKDESFFCPADAKPRDTKDLKVLSATMLGFTELFKQLDESGVGAKLLLVDACREERAGFKGSDSETVPRPSKGTAALFSCKSGEMSYELARLKHGIFFHFVLEGLKGNAANEDNEITWDDLSRYVRRKVARESPKLIQGGGRQTPHEIRNLEGDSPLLLAAAASGQKGKDPTKDALVVKGWTKDIENDIGMKLVRIPAGKFTMGSTEQERKEVFALIKEEKMPDWLQAEGPQHRVEVTKEFWLGAYEVTQKQFQEVMGYNPSCFSVDGAGKAGLEYKFSKPAGSKERVSGHDTSSFPVENVSWEETVQFCKKLTAMTKEKGRTYRLPTEAEWEYACRGGADSYQTFHYGNSLSGGQANFNGEHPHGDGVKGIFLDRTCAVGSYKPNAFGLYDLHGNVAEWCSDWYGADYYGKNDAKDPTGPNGGRERVTRGGCWTNEGRACRSADRSWTAPADRNSGLGFRVVLAASRHGVD